MEYNSFYSFLCTLYIGVLCIHANNYANNCVIVVLTSHNCFFIINVDYYKCANVYIQGVFMNVTIKEVAKLAGVSPSTVSRTCSDHPSISAQTKEKVRRAMQQLGYEPNNSGFSVQNTKTIGIVLPASEYDTYENSFFLETMRGISLFCNQKQYSTTLITGSTDEELIHTIKYMMKDDRLDGVILLYSNEHNPIVDYLYEEGILFVLIGKANHYTSDSIYIDNDNILAAREATNYLLDLGHTRIGYLGSDENRIFSADRKSGYMLSLAEHGIMIRKDYCIQMSCVPKNATEELTNLLSMEDRPTALVVSDDILAMVLERTAYELNLRIPEDLSIISFNNSLFAQLTSPQLTSIDVNSRQLGIEAASQIINHIENPDLLATKIIVPHFLVERESCTAYHSAE